MRPQFTIDKNAISEEDLERVLEEFRTGADGSIIVVDDSHPIFTYIDPDEPSLDEDGFNY